ncbi:MAG: hypothetical protein PHT84_02205 [Candidatus Pacebacteria bacterium]|nr:hypothetical protein [Candidatus Paceibacterota bacterium]
MVRAFDKAGNVREVSLNLFPGYNLLQKLDNYGLYILLIIIFFLLLELILHYLFGHHILDHLSKAYRFFRRISEDEDKNKEDSNNKENPL